MNEQKFCFIICTNNDVYLDECIHYINHLIIPKGFEIDLITIKDAPSMTQGYNEGMNASDAKYKIYMHQDVFLLNKYLLFDLLDIFQSDPLIGMVGMVGYQKIAADGVMWHESRSGAIFTPQFTYPNLADYRYSLKKDKYEYVAVIDGLFMVTCHDLPWDTEHITGWDFYDAFQSIHFLEQGYKIAVPNQHHPWCLHDDKQVLSMFNYNKPRQLFIQKYENYLGKSYLEILNACRS